MKIIFATGNEGKLREIRKIMEGRIPVVSMKEAGFAPDIEENGTTFKENALIKARSLGVLEEAIVMADDSGLVVDALDGRPGVYSARFMGEDTPYTEKCAAIVKELDGVPYEKRTARFTAAIAAVFPDGTESVVEEHMEGFIGYEMKGKNGFGYDPIFVLPSGLSSAEISPDEKNAISHRGKALREMKPVIEAWLSAQGL